MPIEVISKKLTARPNDLPDQIRVDMLNQVLDDFAGEVLNALGKLNCEKHPKKSSRITILSDRTHTLVIIKKFCCPKFEKMVSLKIER